MNIIWVIIFCILAYAVINSVLYCAYVNVTKTGIDNDEPTKYMMILVVTFYMLKWIITGIMSMKWLLKIFLFISRHPGLIYKDKFFKDEYNNMYRVLGYESFNVDSSILVIRLSDKSETSIGLYEWSKRYTMKEITEEEANWSDIK